MQQSTEASDAMRAEAYISGRRAGLSNLPPSPEHPPGTPLYTEWLRGHASGRVAAGAQSRAVGKALQPLCQRLRQACHCGGRGICHDIA